MSPVSPKNYLSKLGNCARLGAHPACAEPLKGMVAVITGATNDVGKAIAHHLMAAGVLLSLGDADGEKLRELADKLLEKGATVRFTVGDITKAEQAKRLMMETERTYQRLDILVNNTSLMYHDAFTDGSVENWSEMIDVNCKGLVSTTSTAIDSMLRLYGGHIISVSSVAGQKGVEGLAVYSGTRFFLQGFFQSLKFKLGNRPIRISTIQVQDTETTVFVIIDEEVTNCICSSFGSSSQTRLEMGKTNTPPDDIARAVVYAASQPIGASVNEISFG